MNEDALPGEPMPVQPQVTPIQTEAPAAEPQAPAFAAAPAEFEAASGPEAPTLLEAFEPASAQAAEPAPAQTVQPAPAEAAEPATAPAAEPVAGVQTQATPPEPSAEAVERRRRAQEAWARIAGARESNELVHGFVKSAVKGGLLVEIDGYRGFLPASQAGASKGTALEPLVNTTLPLRVLDVDEARKRVVVSHRRALQDQRRSARTELMQSLKVGDERDATVLRLADFGAFVDIGGVDALIPASELAFERVDKPSDVVQPGDKFKVRVMRVENGGKKIAVSRKASLPDPWRDSAEVIKQGRVVEGKVVSKEPRLQIEIAPGVVGSLGERDADPAEYEIGETVEVSIRSVDYRNRRIRLTTAHSAASFSPTGFAPLGVELKR